MGDALGWTIAVCTGLAITAAAVKFGARLGTASAPFLGHYRCQIGFGSLLAPAVAVLVATAAKRGWIERARWAVVQVASYWAALAWALSLALVDGAAGLTRGLDGPDEYLRDLATIGDNPSTFLTIFTAHASTFTPATRGHPPAPILLLWLMQRAGITNHLALGLLITGLGTLAVPLILAALRDSNGELAARRYAPVLCLAPYAVWSAVSMDAIVTLLGAALIVAGVHASRRQAHGWSAARWALLAGLLTGVAALFSYAAPWLGLSLVFLYFARRRPFLNIATGVGALIPVIAAQLAGFGWVEGLRVAHQDYSMRVELHRSCCGGAASAWSRCSWRPGRRSGPAPARSAIRPPGRSSPAPPPPWCSLSSPGWPAAASNTRGYRSSRG